MQESATLYPGMPRGAGSETTGSARRRVVSIGLIIMIAILVGGSLFWLQSASQRGIALGYPQPSVHIAVQASGTLVLHQNYQFTANASGRDLSYLWDFGDQAGFSGPSVTHSYQSNGNFTVTVIVYDGANHSATDHLNVTVLPPPPQASFNYYTDGYGDASFDASGSSADPSTSIVSYQWNFGDGTSDTTSYPQDSHYYSSSGVYQVTLIVVDGTGQQSTPAVANIGI